MLYCRCLDIASAVCGVICNVYCVCVPDAVSVLRFGWFDVHDICELVRSSACGVSGHLAQEELCGNMFSD